MPRNSSGVYTLPPIFEATPGTVIQAQQHNTPLLDIAEALTNSLPRNGVAPMLGALQMNGNKITGLAAGTANGDAVRFEQLPVFGAWLTSVSSLSLAANEMVYASGTNTAAKTALTAAGRAFLDDADAAAQRATLELQHSPAVAGIIVAEASRNFNTFLVAGVHTVDGNWTNGPSGAGSFAYAGTLFNVRSANTAGAFMTQYLSLHNQLWQRTGTGVGPTWGAWQDLRGRGLGPPNFSAESGPNFPTTSAIAFFAHGLGQIPNLVKVYAVPVVDVHGYSAGMKLELSSMATGDIGHSQLEWDASFIRFIRGASGHFIVRLDSGVVVNISNSDSYKLRVEAWV